VQLTNHGSVDADCPAWSPDGSKIAYHANQDNYRDVFVIGANGGTPQRLTHREGLDVAPSWSRDGRWIYFASDRSGERCVWKIPSGGGEAVRVTTGSHVQESFDGKTLFVDDAAALWSMPAAGGPRSRLLDRTWANANFEVREEGIYLLSIRALSFYNFKSKSISKVFETPQPTTWGLAIAPDGKSVLFAQKPAEEADIMIMGEFR
jgi:dipeptidyl aminopeptidase/acylaminoacyl peptidase